MDLIQLCRVKHENLNQNEALNYKPKNQLEQSNGIDKTNLLSIVRADAD